MHPTFRERYCELYKLEPAKFEQHVFYRTLYWHTWPVVWLLFLVPDFFLADREFIRGVGDMRSRRQFHAESSDFQSHRSNRTILRSWLRFRVSTKRVRDLVMRVWAVAPSHEQTTEPIN